jgi:glycosyltransferase involved in cell wall biosynthesis
VRPKLRRRRTRGLLSSLSMTSPEVSVIIPVRNGARSIGALLESLEAQTLPAEQFEVIVVDNGSSDATSEVAAGTGARVVQEPIANRSRARNRGAAAARSRLYAFTDADCVAEPGWLEALTACRDRAPLVAGDVRIRVRKAPNAIERFEELWRFGQEHWVEQGWAATANLLVHADAFEAIRGFDASWRHIGEDVDFCFRAKGAGFELGYCAEAVVEHDGERELGPMLQRFFRHGYSVNQAFYRLGVGYRAWRDPRPALFGDAALRQIGHSPAEFERCEWRRMARLARLGYAARVAGSAWAEAVRAR